MGKTWETWKSRSCNASESELEDNEALQLPLYMLSIHPSCVQDLLLSSMRAAWNDSYPLTNPRPAFGLKQPSLYALSLGSDCPLLAACHIRGTLI